MTDSDQNPLLFTLGGACGIAGTLCYVIAATLPLSQLGTYVLAMAWPILSIVFIFSLFRFIALEKQSASNQLAFVFGCLAFAMVAIMISSQLAVKTGIEEYIENSPEADQNLLQLMRRSIRLVDMGIDVAWDLFIGTALIFLAFALKTHHQFGSWWGTPAALLGLLLIVLNVITFPWPPNTRNLFDVGPVVGVYILTLSTRIFLLGNRMRLMQIKRQ